MINQLKRWIRSAARDGLGVQIGPVGVQYSLTADTSQYTSADAAMAIATVYRCVRLLSESVASLPFRYLRRNDTVYEADTKTRFNYLLGVSPCRDMGAFDFWMQAVQHVLLYGNAYIVPVWMDGQLSRLALANPYTVTHSRLSGEYAIADRDNGLSGRWYEREIIHLKGQTDQLGNGVSVLSYARQTLAIQGASEAETLDRFINGGSVRGIISNIQQSVGGFGKASDDQIAKCAADVEAALRRGGRILAMPGGVQFSPMALTAADMQFLQTRKFTVREICRFFGVHPSYVFDDAASNYKSAEMADVAFLSKALNPLLLQIENEFNRKLVKEWDWGRVKFEFDRQAIYNLDLDSQANYMTKMQAIGAFTPNHCRQLMNMAPVEGGDVVMLSANLKPLKEITQNGEQPDKA